MEEAGKKNRLTGDKRHTSLRDVRYGTEGKECHGIHIIDSFPESFANRISLCVLCVCFVNEKSLCLVNRETRKKRRRRRMRRRGYLRDVLV